MLDGFAAQVIDTSEASIFVRWAGSGPPVLLLHGFPQSHVMWRGVAPLLARDLTVVCADLRGYGRSNCPASSTDHAPYSKRAMARDMVEVLAQFGFQRFAVVGHDRGGRVAYRMALDHPERVSRLGVLDVLPTSAVWDRADARFAVTFWPWSLLAQPAPLPERLMAAAPDAVIDNALAEWGSRADAFPAEIRIAYIDALRDPEHVHAICEEYRAAATIDREHDAADLAAGRRITCPLLALWGAGGSLQTWYADEGGPLALWEKWAHDVQGRALSGGHFFPEESPEETATTLRAFLSAEA
jgi:haloacetate dehalogenase